MVRFRTAGAASVGAVAAAVIFVGLGSATPTAAYYWSSFDAEQAIENSDWGDARGVGNVDCAGKGTFKKGIIGYEFTRFRCELENRSYDRIGFVTLFTTGPESFRTQGYIAARCH